MLEFESKFEFKSFKDRITIYYLQLKVTKSIFFEKLIDLQLIEEISYNTEETNDFRNLLILTDE